MDLLQSADLVRTLYDFVGRDGIKITMATEQVRDAKSLTYSWILPWTLP